MVMEGQQGQKSVEAIDSGSANHHEARKEFLLQWKEREREDDARNTRFLRNQTERAPSICIRFVQNSR